MRRAIVEPYEVALHSRLDRFRNTYEKYISQVLPAKDQYAALRNAPNSISVQASMREISHLYAEGRRSKNSNIWNLEWETGITCFIDAFDKLEHLETTLQDFCYKYDQLVGEQEVRAESRRGLGLGWWGLIVGVISFILTVVTVFYPSVGETIRKFLGLP